MSLAEGVLAVAVRLLPRSSRDRYRAEYASELAELPRGEHLGYAIRVLVTAPRLGWALDAALRTRTLIVVSLVALLGVTVVGWQAARAALLRTPFEIRDAAGPAPTIAWSAGVDASTTQERNPTRVEVTGRLVLIQDDDSTHAFDPQTGIAVWSDPDPHLGSILHARDVAPHFVGLADGTLIDARTGTLARTAPTDAAAHAWTADDLITLHPLDRTGCGPSRVTATRTDGTRSWSTTATMPADHLPSGPERAGSHLFIGSSLIGSSDLVPTGLFGAVLDAATGTPVQQGPCLEGRATAFAPVGDHILRIDETWDRTEASATLLDASGRPIWTVDGPAVAASGMVFAQTRATSDQRLTTQRLSAETGLPAWPRPTDGGRVRVVGDAVIVLDQLYQPTGRLTIVDAATGSPRANHRLPFEIADAISDGTSVYAWAQLDVDDELPKALPVVAFDLGTGAELWRATFSRGTDVRLSDGSLVLVDDIAGQAHGLSTPGRP